MKQQSNDAGSIDPNRNGKVINSNGNGSSNVPINMNSYDISMNELSIAYSSPANTEQPKQSHQQ